MERPVSYCDKDIGRYATEHGPIAVAKHFSKILRFFVPEASVRCFKKECLNTCAS